jgi:hypothetical protein
MPFVRSASRLLEVTRLVRVIVVLATVVVITFPFGFYRAYTRKMSWRWFLAIHLPVPLVFLARFESHLSWAFIPFTCMAFAAGQLLGAKAGRWWMQRHTVVPATDKPKDL